MRRYLFILVSSLLIMALFLKATLSDEDVGTNNASGIYAIKHDVIYGKLAAKGQTQTMYVVNAFEVDELGEFVDYGRDANVRNLTDLSDIKQTNDNEVHFQAEDEEIYYQGELKNKPLPWDLSITYELDGKKI